MKKGDALSQSKGWEIKKLGDVCSLEYGKPLDKSKRKTNGLYPVYGANGVIDRSDDFFIDGKSIIVGRKGSAGEIKYTEDKFWPLDVSYYTKFDKKVLNIDKENENEFSYCAGSIENPQINKCIVDVLEGTMPAFENRKTKYQHRFSRN